MDGDELDCSGDNSGPRRLRVLLQGCPPKGRGTVIRVEPVQRLRSWGQAISGEGFLKSPPECETYTIGLLLSRGMARTELVKRMTIVR